MILLCAGGGYNPSDLSSYFAGLGIAEPRVTAVSANGATNSPTSPAAPPTLTPMAKSYSTSKSPGPSPPERMLEGHIAAVSAVAFRSPMVTAYGADAINRTSCHIRRVCRGTNGRQESVQTILAIRRCLQILRKVVDWRRSSGGNTRRGLQWALWPRAAPGEGWLTHLLDALLSKMRLATDGGNRGESAPRHKGDERRTTCSEFARLFQF
jgi:hypothetical protein